MDDNIIRILISTDNHLGFKDRDPIRGDDSYAAFEEVLCMARKRKADFVLLAGDTFHDNKPQRRTMHASMELLRKYTYGHDECYLEVMNPPDQKIVETPTGRPNFQDPCHAISLPVFAIHGNHDEPTRDGGPKSLSALDLLSEANLINYFGKSERVDQIEIDPILIRKKDTRLAIYGLGAISDERLNRMFEQTKVHFKRPLRKDYFHIFVVHQSADKGRGRKSCLHESMIPEWMDLVVWGNEHECRNELQEGFRGAETFRIIQPGSSVATSYNETESVSYPKYMAFFMVKLDKVKKEPRFQMQNKKPRGEELRYTQYRPLLLKDINLKEDSGLDPSAHDIEEKLTNYLHKICTDAITEAQEHAKRCENGPRDALYKVRDPQKVLIRMRVEHSGFPTLNPQRFGARFLNRVANPEALLYFYRKRTYMANARADGSTQSKVAKQRQKHGDNVDAEGAVSIEELIDETLSKSNKPMEVLTGDSMAEALKQFVDHKSTSSIVDAVDETIRKTSRKLYSAAVDQREQIIEAIRQLNPVSATASAPVNGDADADADATADVDVDAPPPAPPIALSSSSKRGAAKKKASIRKVPEKKKTVDLVSDDDDDGEMSESEGIDSDGAALSDESSGAHKKKKTTRVSAKAGGRSKAVAVSRTRKAATAPQLDVTSNAPGSGKKRKLPQSLFGGR